jgi:Tol biopolymer transport system component
MLRRYRWLCTVFTLCVVTASLLGTATVNAGGAYPATMAWSPDGQYVVYAEYGANGPRIFDRTGESVQYHELEALVWNPAWSPDSRKLAFLTNEPALRLLDIEAGESEILLGQNFGGAQIHWSPDGEWIAINENASRGAIYLIAGDGSSIERIGAERAYFIAWSPDGSQFLLWQNDVLYVGTPGETALTPLHDGQFKAHVFAEWSADSSRIAITLIDAETEVIDVFVVENDGENLEPVTEDQNAIVVGWAEDDAAVVYVTTNDRVQDLWIAKLASGEVRNLTGSGTFGFHEVFLNYDRTLAVFYRAGMYVLRLEDGEMREFDGGMFALAPDDNLLAVAASSTNDEIRVVSLDELWETPVATP